MPSSPHSVTDRRGVDPISYGSSDASVAAASPNGGSTLISRRSAIDCGGPLMADYRLMQTAWTTRIPHGRHWRHATHRRHWDLAVARPLYLQQETLTVTACTFDAVGYPPVSNRAPSATSSVGSITTPPTTRN
jgi:hypothetical protein